MQLGETMDLTARDSETFMARRLAEGDINALRQFYDQLSPRSRRFFLAHGLDNATLRKVMKRSEAEEDLVLGLFAGERLIGYFFLWYFGERVPLLGVGLLDAFQGRGLGRAMIELLIAESREQGKEGVELTTQMDNARAFALYRKLGFRHYADVANLQGDGSVETERAMFYEIMPGARPLDTPHAPPV